MMPAGERPDDDIVLVHDEQNEQVVARHASPERSMDAPADDELSTDEATEGEPFGDEQIADERAATATAVTPVEPVTPVDPVEPVRPAEPVGEPASAIDDSWPVVQALFVDDPRLAVERAAGLTSDALGALVVAARNREQLLRAAWDAGETGTEELRAALRGYRALSTRVTELAREF